MATTPATHASPKAPRDREWAWEDRKDMDAFMEAGGWDTVARAHAWYDRSADQNDPPHERTAYKLPHHEVIDGELKVVWRGVVAAMTVLNGARGGVDIPERDRRQVYEHLVAHYREFGEEPPELN